MDISSSSSFSFGQCVDALPAVEPLRVERTPPSESPFRPRSMRAADPVAVHLYRQLISDGEVSQRLVFERCEEIVPSLAGASRDEARAVAVAAVRRFHREEAVWPSKPKYNAWYADHDEKALLPSSFKVAYAFGGSFTKAVTAASGGPKADVTVRRLTALGPKFTRPELERLVRQCAFELEQDWLSFPLFRQWASTFVAASPQARVPLSQCTFSNNGGWRSIVRSAGIRPAFVDARGRLVDAPVDRYTDEDLEGALQDGRRAVGRHLAGPLYDQFRLGTLASADIEGVEVAIPSRHAICNRYGGWNDALHAASLIDEAQVSAGHKRRYRAISIEGALKLLGSLLPQDGGDYSTGDYRRWLRSPAAAARCEPPPSLSWWLAKFGTWKEVLNAARAR